MTIEFPWFRVETLPDKYGGLKVLYAYILNEPGFDRLWILVELYDPNNYDFFNNDIVEAFILRKSDGELMDRRTICENCSIPSSVDSPCAVVNGHIYCGIEFVKNKLPEFKVVVFDRDLNLIKERSFGDTGPYERWLSESNVVSDGSNLYLGLNYTRMYENGTGDPLNSYLAKLTLDLEVVKKVETEPIDGIWVNPATGHLWTKEYEYLSIYDKELESLNYLYEVLERYHATLGLGNEDGFRGFDKAGLAYVLDNAIIYPDIIVLSQDGNAIADVRIHVPYYAPFVCGDYIVSLIKRPKDWYSKSGGGFVSIALLYNLEDLRNALTTKDSEMKYVSLKHRESYDLPRGVHGIFSGLCDGSTAYFTGFIKRRRGEPPSIAIFAMNWHS